MKLTTFLCLIILSLTVSCIHQTHQGRSKLHFENLGRPLRSKPVHIEWVTTGRNDHYWAWGVVEGPAQQQFIGADTTTGETHSINLMPYGKTHIRMTRAANGDLYLYSGSPGHFFRFDTSKMELIDLGVPADPAHYWLGDTVGPDGRFYVGTYPTATLVSVDPSTDRIKNHGRLTGDPRQKYLLYPQVSDNNIVYCPAGLHHMELWALDPDTGRKCQILPDPFNKLQGHPTIWTGTDGRVYGRIQNTEFLCKPDGIETGKTCERRSAGRDIRAGNWKAKEFEPDGKLVLEHHKTGETKRVQTGFEGEHVMIHSVCCEYEGIIYGGGFKPSNLFSANPLTGKLKDLGRVCEGKIQIYDILGHPKGLFISSYMDANLDFFDPASPREDGINPRHIASLSEPYGQERIMQLCSGPDGNIYSGAIPVKGHVTGAVVRIDPADFSVKVYENILPNQSFYGATGAPQTGEIFFTTSIYGGTSAEEVAGEAWAVLWDCDKEEVAWKGKPVSGARLYGYPVAGKDGMIYGLAGGNELMMLTEEEPFESRFYIFDPLSRKTVHTWPLPVDRIRLPGLAGHPGPSGLIYGLGDDAIFVIDPENRQARVIARHPSIEDAFGMMVTKDGIMYYGSKAHLWRVDLR